MAWFLGLDACTAGRWATVCCTGALFQSIVQPNRLKPTRREKRSRFHPAYGISMGALIKQTTGIALCACIKQLILIPSRLGGSCLDLCQQHRETKDKRENLRRCSWTLWLLLTSRHLSLLWPRRCSTTISLAARKACSPCHNEEYKTEMDWERGHLIQCQAICSDLSIQFKWPQLLWSTKTLWMTFLLMSFIFPAQSLPVARACCCSTTRRGVNDLRDPVAHL